MDLTDTRATWVQRVVFDADDGSITLELNVPVADDGGTVAEREEIIPMDATTPRELHKKAREFIEALLEHVRSRHEAVVGEVRCVTCTGACCGRAYNEVHVTSADLERLTPALVAQGVDVYEEVSWTGYAGVLKRRRWSGVGAVQHEDDAQPMACVFLDPKTSLCTIYAQRPEVCVTYTAYDCEHHDPAPHTLVQLRKKKMPVSDG